MGLLISGFEHDTKNQNHQTLSLTVVPATTAMLSSNTAVINLVTPQPSLKFTVFYSLASNPSDASATLSTLTLTIILHSAVSTVAQVGYYSQTVTALIAFSLVSTKNTIAETDPDYIFGFSSIKMGLDNQNAAAMALSIHLILGDSQNALLTSTSATNYI